MSSSDRLLPITKLAFLMNLSVCALCKLAKCNEAHTNWMVSCPHHTYQPEVQIEENWKKSILILWSGSRYLPNPNTFRVNKWICFFNWLPRCVRLLIFSPPSFCCACFSYISFDYVCNCVSISTPWFSILSIPLMYSFFKNIYKLHLTA